MVLPLGSNQRWTLDFLSDAMTDGAASASWPSSMTSRANVWPWSLIRPCQACGLRASSPSVRNPRPSSNDRFR